MELAQQKQAATSPEVDLDRFVRPAVPSQRAVGEALSVLSVSASANFFQEMYVLERFSVAWHTGVWPRETRDRNTNQR